MGIPILGRVGDFFKRGAPGVGQAFGFADEERQRAIDDALRSEEARLRKSRELGEILRSDARGSGPSVANATLARASDQGFNAQQGALSAGRPAQGGLLQNMAARSSAGAGSDLSGRIASQRLVEQQQARQTLADLLLNMRGQDIQLGQIHAGIPTDTARFAGAGADLLAFLESRGGR